MRKSWKFTEIQSKYSIGSVYTLFDEDSKLIDAILRRLHAENSAGETMILHFWRYD